MPVFSLPFIRFKHKQECGSWNIFWVENSALRIEAAAERQENPSRLREDCRWKPDPSEK